MYLSKTYIPFILILITIGCKAQGITISVEDRINYDFDEVQIAQVKDINNVFSNYVDTWKVTYNGNVYEFRITKNTATREHEVNVLNKFNYTEDELLMRCLIKDSSGNIIDDTTNLTNDDDFITRGLFFRDGDYEMGYSGRYRDCGTYGSIYLTKTTNGLTLYHHPREGSFDNCANGVLREESIPPNVELVLTKQ